MRRQRQEPGNEASSVPANWPSPCKTPPSCREARAGLRESTALADGDGLCLVGPVGCSFVPAILVLTHRLMSIS